MKKKLLAVLVFLCCVFATCCAPHAMPPAQTIAAPAKPNVPPLRHFELTLHVDTSFNEQGRAIIEEAARRWSVLTRGRAELTVVFDLDLESVENLQQHKTDKDSLVLGVESDDAITQAIDESLDTSPGHVLAATVHSEGGPILVFLIVDRIAADHFLAVVTHEFGHVIGLPDMPTTGSIMSGVEVAGVPPPDAFTPADAMLCRAAHYCD